MQSILQRRRPKITRSFAVLLRAPGSKGRRRQKLLRLGNDFRRSRSLCPFPFQHAQWRLWWYCLESLVLLAPEIELKSGSFEYCPTWENNGSISLSWALKWELKGTQLAFRKDAQVIYQAWVFHHQRKTQKRFENTRRSREFLTNFDVFHLVVKHGVECLILFLKQNDFGRRN